MKEYNKLTKKDLINELKKKGCTLSKPEPLKKECTCGLRRHRHDEDIKSAVEWLKKEDKKVYKEIVSALEQFELSNSVIGVIRKLLDDLEYNKEKTFPDLK